MNSETEDFVPSALLLFPFFFLFFFYLIVSPLFGVSSLTVSDFAFILSFSSIIVSSDGEDYVKRDSYERHATRFDVCKLSSEDTVIRP